jgi:hypothetical protein
MPIAGGYEREGLSIARPGLIGEGYRLVELSGRKRGLFEGT